MSGDFVHLHTHSHYSLLDCTATIEKLVQAAVDGGMKALAVTDHGNMFGAVEFYDAAKQAGIKPIIGYEAYVAPDSRFSRQARGIAEASYHLTLLAADETGYKNLLRLASAAYTEGFYYKPRIDKDLLSERSDGLVCLSGCLSGEISQLLSVGEHDRARDTAAFYRDIFGKKRFYIEVQDHGLEPQRRVLPGLVAVAEDLALPLAATNDSHYISRSDADAHDALLCINTGRLVSDVNRMRFQGKEFYFKSPAEMAALFRDYPSAISDTAAIAEMCNLDLAFGQLHLPRFDPPNGMTPEQYLRGLCEDGFKRLYTPGDTAARERLEKEISVISRMGLAGYFLIVSDFVRFAREENIPVGPGRGSAAACMVYTVWASPA